jgi:murein DD-endopeptidase MepM/ murein hydrolase activator NlpD
VPILQGWGQGSSPWTQLFHDHEIHVRTGGQVRFLLVSAALQRRVASVVVAVLAAWLVATAALLGWQAWTSWKTRDVAARSVAVSQAEARVAAERKSVEGIAASLDARQDNIEALFRTHFGDDPDAAARATDAPASRPADPAAAQAPAQPQAPAQTQAPAQARAQAAAADRPADQVARLEAIAARQDVLVRSMTAAVTGRAERAELALRKVGLKASAQMAQGGPFLPWPEKRVKPSGDPALGQLIAALTRMEQLESLLLSLPSDLPAEGMELSSGFGVRYDPFNGERAMHAGLDFRGAVGTPIRTAAAGRVSFVGVKNGYGNVVEVDHGHGLLTRYAHLSAFGVREGQAVQSGDRIALMGSTGRSTGPHLHFEVRVNGTAVNPRPFLEANRDVLEIKADAGSRLGRRLAAG